MGKLVIQYHNFENAKKELKKFSEQTTTDLDLKRVDNSKRAGEFLGDLFWGRGIGLDHKVTGEELNDLTSQIQTHLHSINNTQIKLIKEFGQVYSALEALDNDYIQAILVSIKSTEEASQSIQKTQEQIKQIVKYQKKTLEELKKFKQKLDGYDHLDDIDKIWTDCQSWYKEIHALSKSIESATESSQESAKKVEEVKVALTLTEQRIEALSKQSSVMSERLESVIAFTKAIEYITHLKDVDEMWESLSSIHHSINNISEKYDSIQKIMSQNQEDVNNILDFMESLSELNHLMEVDKIWKQTEDHQLRIKDLERVGKIHTDKLDELVQADVRILERIDSNVGDINRLKEYKEKLSDISHLEDVDSMWKDIEEHTSQLTESKKRDEGLATAIQKNKEEVDEKIAGAVQTTNDAVESLTKKIKYAYLIAGGSAGLAIIELILLLMKVI